MNCLETLWLDPLLLRWDWLPPQKLFQCQIQGKKTLLTVSLWSFDMEQYCNTHTGRKHYQDLCVHYSLHFLWSVQRWEYLPIEIYSEAHWNAIKVGMADHVKRKKGTYHHLWNVIKIRNNKTMNLPPYSAQMIQ